MVEALALFSGGIGFDRLSDVVCNVLKSYFITYTQAVCLRHNVPMERFRVVNAAWDEESARWLDLDLELPVNRCVGMRHRYCSRPSGSCVTFRSRPRRACARTRGATTPMTSAPTSTGILLRTLAGRSARRWLDRTRRS